MTLQVHPLPFVFHFPCLLERCARLQLRVWDTVHYTLFSVRVELLPSFPIPILCTHGGLEEQAFGTTPASVIPPQVWYRARSGFWGTSNNSRPSLRTDGLCTSKLENQKAHSTLPLFRFSWWISQSPADSFGATEAEASKWGGGRTEGAKLKRDRDTWGGHSEAWMFGVIVCTGHPNKQGCISIYCWFLCKIQGRDNCTGKHVWPLSSAD